MIVSEIEKDDEALLVNRGHGFILKVALICLLLGIVFLMMPRVLAVSSHPLSQAAGFLGWGFLASSFTVLLMKSIQLQLSFRRSSPEEIRNRLLRSYHYYMWLSAVGPARKRAARTVMIDRLYAELRPLMSRAATDPSLRDEVQAKLSLLRQLQSEEADEMEQLSNAALLLKPSEAREALERARAVLSRYENPAPQDAATESEN